MLCRLFVSFCRFLDRFCGHKRPPYPWCKARTGHSPACRCATRKELEAAYHWTQGRLTESHAMREEAVKTWVSHYWRERQANAVLKHENNKLRAAKYPPRTKVS